MPKHGKIIIRKKKGKIDLGTARDITDDSLIRGMEKIRTKNENNMMKKFKIKGRQKEYTPPFENRLKNLEDKIEEYKIKEIEEKSRKHSPAKYKKLRINKKMLS